jgi:hypothetical protein
MLVLRTLQRMAEHLSAMVWLPEELPADAEQAYQDEPGQEIGSGGSPQPDRAGQAEQG